MSILSDTVVSNEPVVDVEDDEEGGEAGEGDDVKDARVVDQEHEPVLVGGGGGRWGDKWKTFSETSSYLNRNSILKVFNSLLQVRQFNKRLMKHNWI